MIPVFLFGLSNVTIASAAGYDRDAVATYAGEWWNTDLDVDGKVDNINWPTHSYYLKNGTSYNRSTNHNALNKDFGWDCANFGSQCIMAGGVNLGLGSAENTDKGIGRGGTTIRVGKLRSLLKSISTTHKFERKEDAAVILSTGDVVTWQKITGDVTINHTTIIVKGSGPNALLAAHSNDRKQASLSTYFDNGYKKAIAFHITGLNARASADQTSPTVLVKNSSTGQEISEGSVTNPSSIDIQVTEIGGTFDGLNVFRGESQTDAGDLADLSKGIFGDPQPVSNTRTYTVSSLPEDRIVIDAWDNAGNHTQRTFAIDRRPPQIAGYSPQGSNIPLESDISIEVNKKLSRATVNGSIQVQNGTTALAGNIQYLDENESQSDVNEDGDTDDKVLVFQPSSRLPAGAVITVIVKDSLTDEAGNKLDGDGNGVAGGNFTWSFQTEIPPPLIAHRLMRETQADDDLVIQSTMTAYLSSVSRAQVYYRRFSDTSSRYNKIDMAFTGTQYQAVIPGSDITVSGGLEYFIYAQDSSGKVSTLPPGIPDPFFYSSTASVVTAFSVGNEGYVVRGDTDTSNDNLVVAFHLLNDIPAGHSVNLEIYETDSNFSKMPGDRADDVFKDVLRGPLSKGPHSFSVNGAHLVQRNYFFALQETDGATQNLNTLIAQGRFQVVFPLAIVEVIITSGINDTVRTAVSGTSQKLAASTVFQAQSLFHPYGQQGSGPNYTTTVPHSQKGHQSSVYSTVAGRHTLIGISGVPTINTEKAPEITVLPIVTQTNNHPIAVQAQITDQRTNGTPGQVQSAQLNFRDSGASSFQFVAMTSVGNGLFEGVIPSQPGNNTVLYFVSATDNEGHTSSDPWIPLSQNLYFFNVVVDNTPPSVIKESLVPSMHETEVSINSVISTEFSEPLRSLDPGVDSFQVQDSSGNVIDIQPESVQLTDNRLSFRLKSNLKSQTKYTVTLFDQLSDLSGNQLDGNGDGSPGGHFSWSFETEAVLPVSIRSLSQAPVNFSSSTTRMIFSAVISTPVNSVTIVLENQDTKTVFRLEDSTGTPENGSYPFNYAYSWNGLLNGAPIPEGAYSYHVEAVDRMNGMVSTSEIQPFRWKVDVKGIISYQKVAKEETFLPTHDQYVRVEYDYPRFSNDPCRVNGVGMGSSQDQFLGKTGVGSVFVPGNNWIGVSKGDSDYCYITYNRTYQDVSGRGYFQSDTGKSKVDAVPQGQHISSDPFVIKSDPILRDQYEILHGTNINGDPYEINFFSRNQSVTLLVQYVRAPVEGEDFDDNPAVLTSVKTMPIGNNSLQIQVDARNIEEPPTSIIYDTTPPQLSLMLNHSIFSPVLNQNVVATFALSDNLPFGLRESRVQAIGSTGALVSTLYYRDLDVDGDRALKWDGKDQNGLIVPDGVYTIKASAKDAVGNYTEVTTTVIVDNTPPLIENAALKVTPGDKPLVFRSHDRSIDVDFDLSDNLSTLSNVTLTGADTSLPNEFAMNYSFSVSSSPHHFSIIWDGKDIHGNPIPDGLYNMTLTAADVPGNTTKTDLPKLRIDQTPSLLLYLFADNIVFSPDDGPAGQGDGNQDTVTFTYELGDDADVTLTLENNLGQVIATSTRKVFKGAAYTYSWDGKLSGQYAPDGAYTLRIKTVDDVGNVDSKPVAVIKNQIPAQIVFPKHETFAEVGGQVVIQGVALDPFVNDTIDFDEYQLWVRDGAPTDFSASGNNPGNLDTSLWKPIPVPASYQNSDSTVNTDYPLSNKSKRSILNSTLGIWDTRSMGNGSLKTLLLVLKDKSGRVSYDSVGVKINSAVDLTAPQINIARPTAASPPTEVNFLSRDDRVQIIYDLTQTSGQKANVTVDVFEMKDLSTMGRAFFQRDFFLQDSGQTVLWDGRDVREQPVKSGFYRARITARDMDNMGVDIKDVDFQLNVQYAEPIIILSFNASSESVNPGGTITLSYQLSKPGLVDARAYDIENNQVGSFSAQNSSGSFTFSIQIPGLYRWELKATSVDSPSTESSASLSIAVGNPVSGNDLDISGTSPLPVNGAVPGAANYRWQVSGTGKYYPPQSFAATIKADGKEVANAQTVTETSFQNGTNTNVVNSNGDLLLALVSNTQQQIMRNYEFYIWSGRYFGAESISFPNSGYLRQAELLVLRPKPNSYYSLYLTLQVRKDRNGHPGDVLGEYDFGKINWPSTPANPNDMNSPSWYGANFNVGLSANARYWVVGKFRSVYTTPSISDLESYLGRIEGTDFDSYGNGFYLYSQNADYDADIWYPGGSFPILHDNIKDLCFKVAFESYAPSGQYISPAIDTQKTAQGTTAFEPFKANATNNSQIINYAMQMSDDNSNWDPSFAVTPGQPITKTGKRYFRNIVELVTADTRVTPVAHDYTVTYSVIEPFSLTNTVDTATTWVNHPVILPDTQHDLSTYFPALQNKNLTAGPDYSVTDSGNPNVTAVITSENAMPQLKATTSVQENWNSPMDAGIAGGRFGDSFQEFNNNPQPVNFTVEAPFSFDQSDYGLKPLVISAGYPTVDMQAQDSVRNKYSFWKDANGKTIDNPYVVVDAANGGWDVQLAYPNGKPNDTLLLNHDKTKASNTNIDPDTLGTPMDVDDDFTVKMTSGTIPKVFIELKGNTPSAAAGFQSYAMFYRKSDENVFHSITVPDPLKPIPAGGTLAYWDVTGLRGDYEVKLVVFRSGGQNVAVKNITVGTFVPSAASATGITEVNGPYNKAFLEFPKGALAKNSVVTITPRKLSDTTLTFDSSMPLPIGAVYDMQPQGIEFVKDANGLVTTPATLTIRFLPDELKGVDPGQLVLYDVSESGALQAMDARVSVKDNGITEIVSPVTSFSYFLVLPTVLPPVIRSAAVVSDGVLVTGTADPSATLDIFVNQSQVDKATVGADGNFSFIIKPVEGRNILQAKSHLFFGVGDHKVERVSALSVPFEFLLDTQKPSLQNVRVVPQVVFPQEAQSAALRFVLSEPSYTDITLGFSNCSDNCFRHLLTNQKLPVGHTALMWDGKNDQGGWAPDGKHQFTIDARDLSGNKADSAIAFVTTLPPEPPKTDIRAPLAGETYGDSARQLLIDFSVTDNVDLNPSFHAFLTELVTGAAMAVQPQAVIDPLTLNTGLWKLNINMVDRSGYASEAESGPFIITRDTVPPAAVTTLRAVPISSDTIRLSCLVTGDDGLMGDTPAYYRVVLSNNPDDFNLNEYINQGPFYLKPAAPFQFDFGGLEPVTPYRVEIYLADDLLNWSDISNIVSTTTLPIWFADHKPPVGPLIQYFPLASFNEITIQFEDEFDGVSLVGPVTAVKNGQLFTDFTLERLANNAFRIRNLSPGDGVYVFLLQARDQAGNIAEKTQVTVLDLLPSLADVTVESGAQFNLMWTQPGSVEAYVCKYSATPIASEDDFEAAGELRVFIRNPFGSGWRAATAQGAEPGKDYYLSLAYLDFNGNRSGFSNVQNSSATAGTIKRSLGRASGIEWGDYNNDGDADLLTKGSVNGIYENRNGTMDEFANNVRFGSDTWSDGQWLDYNNDSLLDVMAITSNGLKFWKNTGGGYFKTDTDQPQINMIRGHLAAGDIDNNGYPDLVVSGYTCVGLCFDAVVLRNNHGVFSIDRTQPIPSYGAPEVLLSDLDNDGDLDLIASARYPYGASVDTYENQDGQFTYKKKLMDWGGHPVVTDLDHDGYKDIVVGGEGAGYHIGAPGLYVLLNKGGSFPVSRFFPASQVRSLQTADLNNDGTDEIIAAVGAVRQGALVRELNVYVWDGTALKEEKSLNRNFVDSSPSAYSFSDYDRDGDLDMALLSLSRDPIFVNMRAENGDPNHPPSTPANLNAQFSNGLILTWDPSTDDKTPANSLEYNVRIGTAHAKSDVLSGTVGNRLLGKNVSTRLSATQRGVRLSGLPPGKYYYSVQTVDTGLAVSSWSPEQRYPVNTPPVCAPIPNHSVEWGHTRSFTFNCSDSTNDPLTLSVSNLPEGATFTTPVPGSGQGVFSWNPRENQVGVYSTIRFTAIDADFTVQSGTFTFRVRPERVAPAPVSNLTAIAAPANAIQLTWTLTGDNGFSGECTGYYRIAITTAPKASFSANRFSQQGTLWLKPGAIFKKYLPGFSANTTYYAAVFLGDDVPNWSMGSNVVAVQPSSAPVKGLWNPIADLAAKTESQIVLSWTAPVLEEETLRPSAHYIVKHATAPISNQAGFDSASLVDSPQPLPLKGAGLKENLRVSSLIAGTTYYFCVVYQDAFGNTSAINPGPLAYAIAGRFSWTPFQSGLVKNGSQVQLGDFDSDGDLDCLVYGNYSGKGLYVLRNEQGAFSSVLPINASALVLGLPHWVDYNKDGLLDVIAMENTSKEVSDFRFKFYVNKKDHFEEDLSQSFLQAGTGNFEVSDIDNDGDPDLVFSGYSCNGPCFVNEVYRNDDGIFVRDTGQSLPTYLQYTLHFIDADNDNDEDLVMTTANSAPRKMYLYSNQGGKFSFSHEIAQVHGPSASMDVDRDDDLDLIVMGDEQAANFAGPALPVGRVYVNTNGRFSESQRFEGIQASIMVKGDVDNDGDPDIVVSGFSVGTFLYYNDQGKFGRREKISGSWLNSLVLGDVDGDGFLDLVTSLGVFKGVGLAEQANKEPSIPTGFNINLINGDLQVNWNPSTDSKSLKKYLSYNVEIGQSSSTFNLVSGAYGSPLLGNRPRPVRSNSEIGYLLKNPPPPPYFIRVQSIDAGLRASAWSSLRVFPNTPPRFKPITNHSIQAEEAFSMEIEATDDEEDVLILKAANLPLGASFVNLSTAPGKGRLKWTPGNNQAGSYTQIQFSTTDGEFTAKSGTFTITVLPLPDRTPPGSVNNFSMVTISSDTIRANWTLTGDDGLAGTTAGTYRLVLSTDPFSTLDLKDYLLSNSVLLESGRLVSVDAKNLLPGATYRGAVYLADEMLNWSARSNIAHATTMFPADRTPPVTTFSLVSPQGPVVLNAVDYGTSGGAPSGVDFTHYSLDGKPMAVYETSLTPFFGFHRIQFYSVDKEGNTEEIKTENFVIEQPVQRQSDVSNVLVLPAGQGNAVNQTPSETVEPLIQAYFVYPNPAEKTFPTFFVQSDGLDQLIIRIFDVNGNPVHEIVIKESPKLVQMEGGAAMAYEYTWTDRVSNGLYFYVIEGRKNGQEIIRKGKFAVAR